MQCFRAPTAPQTWSQSYILFHCQVGGVVLDAAVGSVSVDTCSYTAHVLASGTALLWR